MPRLTPNGFYTTQELADFLKLTPRTIQRWINEGHLPAYRFGKKYRVRGDDFDTFLDEYKSHQATHQVATVSLAYDPTPSAENT